MDLEELPLLECIRVGLRREDWVEEWWEVSGVYVQGMCSLRLAKEASVLADSDGRRDRCGVEEKSSRPEDASVYQDDSKTLLEPWFDGKCGIPNHE